MTLLSFLQEADALADDGNTPKTFSSPLAPPHYHHLRSIANPGRQRSNSSINRGKHDTNANNNRKLQLQQQDYIDDMLKEVIPSFSIDEDSATDVRMPSLTLLLKWSDGMNYNNGLFNNDASYDTIQIAMDVYLERLLEQIFHKNENDDYYYDFVKARTEILIDSPYAFDNDDDVNTGGSVGNAILMETTLTFRDIDIDNDDDQEDEEYNGIGDLGASSSSSNTKRQQGTSQATVVPSENELLYAAGMVWNDLTLFHHQLIVEATIQQTEEVFEKLVSIASEQSFPIQTVPPEATEQIDVDVANNEIPNNNIRPSLSGEQQGQLKQEEEEESTTTTPDRGDNVADAVVTDTGTVVGRNEDDKATEVLHDPNDMIVSAVSSSGEEETSSQLAQTNDEDRKNLLLPLYPALIVGIVVFLCTVVSVGYGRRYKNGKKLRQLDEDDDEENLSPFEEDEDGNIVRGQRKKKKMSGGYLVNDGDLTLDVVGSADDTTDVDYDDDDDDVHEEKNVSSNKKPSKKKQRGRWFSRKQSVPSDEIETTIVTIIADDNNNTNSNNESFDTDNTTITNELEDFHDEDINEKPMLFAATTDGINRDKKTNSGKYDSHRGNGGGDSSTAAMMNAASTTTVTADGSIETGSVSTNNTDAHNNPAGDLTCSALTNPSDIFVF